MVILSGTAASAIRPNEFWTLYIKKKMQIYVTLV